MMWLLFCDAVGSTVGELKGQTLLPIPAAETHQQDLAAKDKAKIHILENSVITWTKQIRNILKADPDASLQVQHNTAVTVVPVGSVAYNLWHAAHIVVGMHPRPDARASCLQAAGGYPGPLTELDFWSERANNLNSIHDQLTGERIQKVVKVLELANSAYYSATERLIQVSRRAADEILCMTYPCTVACRIQSAAADLRTAGLSLVMFALSCRM